MVNGGERLAHCLLRRLGFAGVALQVVERWAHARAFQLEAVSGVGDAVQDRVTERGVPDNFMPKTHGNLAGDQQGAAAVAILDDFQKVAPVLGVVVIVAVDMG